MITYVVRRLLLVIPTLLAVITLIFLAMHMIPGDPTATMMSQSRGINVDEMRHRLGLDLPVTVQYWQFLSNICHGDLGEAIFIRKSVSRIIAEELPYTLRLAGVASIFIIVLGLLFGILSAINVSPSVNSVFTAISVSGLSIPDFWLGLMLIMVFSVKLRWVPIFGPESMKVLVMPAFVLGFRASAMIARLARSGLLEALEENYITTARAKGLAEHAVLIKHALRNALIPVVTILGIQFAQLLGGAVVVETVFARRGIGYLVMTSILQRDYPLVQGTVLWVAVIYVMINIGVDILYPFIDPRIRY